MEILSKIKKKTIRQIKKAFYQQSKEFELTKCRAERSRQNTQIKHTVQVTFSHRNNTQTQRQWYV